MVPFLVKKYLSRVPANFIEHFILLPDISLTFDEHLPMFKITFVCWNGTKKKSLMSKAQKWCESSPQNSFSPSEFSSRFSSTYIIVAWDRHLDMQLTKNTVKSAQIYGQYNYLLLVLMSPPSVQDHNQGYKVLWEVFNFWNGLSN